MPLPSHAICTAAALAVCLCASTATCAPPANDNFANRVTISGAGGTAHGSNVDATGEPGERPVGGVPGATNTVWWQWTAPVDGCYSFDTFGSSFNTVVAFFAGDEMARLRFMYSNNDADFYAPLFTQASALVVPARAGQTFQIAVAGGSGFPEGTITLNWYLGPIHWFKTTGLDTNRVHAVLAAPNGSALSWNEEDYINIVTGTNRTGIAVYRAEYIPHVQNLRLDNRRNKLLALVAQLDDVTGPYTIFQFDGRNFVVVESLGGWLLDRRYALHSYRRKGDRFERDGSYTVSNSIVGAAAVGREFWVWCLDEAYPMHGQFVALQRRLKKVRWQLSFDGEPCGLFGNGLCALAENTSPFTDVSFWKRGRLLHTRRIPPVILGNTLDLIADRRGGLLYWVDHGGTNGPMTYIDKHDTTWFTDFAPQGFSTFDFVQLTPHLLLLAGFDPGGARLQTYRFRRSPASLGETYVPFAARSFVVGGTVYVTMHGGGTSGVRAYDKQLRRVKWENVGAGHTTYPVTPKVFCRVSTNTTSATYTIFKRTRTVAAHSYVP